MDKVKVGLAGSMRDLKCLIEGIDQGFDRLGYEITHFSVGIRWQEECDESIAYAALEKGFSLSIHPVDFNLSGDLNLVELGRFASNIKDLPFSYFEEDLGLWRYGQLFLGAHQTNPELSEPSLGKVVDNVLLIKKMLDLQVVIENPPVYSGAQELEFWSYYSEVCQRSECFMALDVGHYIGHCRTHALPATLPSLNHSIWSKVITVHLSGLKTWSWNGIPVWLDQHSDLLSNEVLDLAKICISRCVALDNILLEMEGASEAVRRQNICGIQTILNGRI